MNADVDSDIASELGTQCDNTSMTISQNLMISKRTQALGADLSAPTTSNHMMPRVKRRLA